MAKTKAKLPTREEIYYLVCKALGEPTTPTEIRENSDGECIMANFVFGDITVSYEFPDSSQFPWTVSKKVMSWPCSGFGRDFPMAVRMMQDKVKEHTENMMRQRDAISRYNFEADIAKVNAIEVG
jgi:hypothetical protein